MALAAALCPAGAETVDLSAAGAAVSVDRDSGQVVSIRTGSEELARPHPAGSERPFAFVEVTDLRDGRIYTPLKVASTISGWQVRQAGGRKVLSFRQQYAGAAFEVIHTLSERAEGLRWSALLRPGKRLDENRSVQVAWKLPLPYGWQFWGPNDTGSHRTDGVTPWRFVYGHTDPGPCGVIIPLVGVWGRRGGLAVWSPPDVHKTQIIFGVHTQHLADPAKGVFRKREDLQMLRVTHHMVGLRPGKDLAFAVAFAGVRGDYRGVLGHYVQTYPELFEPIPQARKYEGMYGITNASALKRGSLGTAQARGITCLEVHGHFPEYGVYVTDEALKDPDLTWRCRPHARAELSLADNRRAVRKILQAGVAPFMYFYNVHANTETVRQRFAADLMRGETGRPNIQYHGEPALRAQPHSGFGKHLIEQMDLMLRAYPEAPGFFVDNFSIQWLSLAHDDGVSMVHHRPAYDMNRNHQDVGPICFDKAHKAGKVIMVNKLATIESARGADMVLIEGMSLDFLKMEAFACVYRSVFPLAWHHRRGPDSLERCMQYLLLYGGTPAATLRGNRHAVRAYRRLTDAMVGKRWVFDPDPLTVPAGYEGQIFRIDPAVSKHPPLRPRSPHAPRGGDVVVTLVDLSRSWRRKQYVDGLNVTVRLPEADELKQATWLNAGLGGEPPTPCQIQRRGGALTIPLPAAGTAGVLRLSRRDAEPTDVE